MIIYDFTDIYFLTLFNFQWGLIGGLTNQTTRKKLSAERLHQILVPWDPNDHQKKPSRNPIMTNVFFGFFSKWPP